ncbi:MAG: dephospho-CoA kinase [Rhodospirillaceae bacterium]
MVILGLTGSIGMGKSTAAVLLRRLGVAVHDADRAVHRLLAWGGAAVPAIAAQFGAGVIRDGAVNRPRLGALVFQDATALTRLESIIHPLVRKAERRFLATAARRRTRVVALDVPLLLETGGERRVDAVIVVTAPGFIQRQRVLARPGMTAAKLDSILERQLPDRIKRDRADFVVQTGLGKGHALHSLAAIVKLMRDPSRLRKSHARNRFRYRDHRL